MVNLKLLWNMHSTYYIKTALNSRAKQTTAVDMQIRKFSTLILQVNSKYAIILPAFQKLEPRGMSQPTFSKVLKMENMFSLRLSPKYLETKEGITKKHKSWICSPAPVEDSFISDHIFHQILKIQTPNHFPKATVTEMVTF